VYLKACKFCSYSEFESGRKYAAHVRNCKLNPERDLSYVGFKKKGAERSELIAKKAREIYQDKDHRCLNCSAHISYEYRANKFCSHSCNAIYYNRIRFGEKIAKEPKPKRTKIIYTYICRYCGNEFLSQDKGRQYCNGSCRNGDHNKTKPGKRSRAEIYLEKRLSEEFSDLDAVYNSRSILKGNKELDLYIPSLKFAVEWNGIHHYKDIRKEGESVVRRKKDASKRKECKELGIHLYVVKDLTSHKSFIERKIKLIISKIRKLLRANC